MVRPPDSTCITARIQMAGIPKRFAAAAISGFQRRIIWPKLMRCSCWNMDGAFTGAFFAGRLAGAAAGEGFSAAAPATANPQTSAASMP